MTARTDVTHGRQGGRIVTGRSDRPAPPCEICGRPMHLGQRRTHIACTEELGYEHPQRYYPASNTLGLRKGSPHHAR